ncbi:muscarinic acetylcholine receptor M2-like [Mercenaria mercenaria]|uniref:muscarinic acetylcholine receptor M2-like n=1 Tax=Mercenaria mercenaria TaxID=6596 RepID=UPI00234F65DA|nr:muscarinic acetylcholine receptor M2-like [Mercenaria mercenaria]
MAEALTFRGMYDAEDIPTLEDLNAAEVELLIPTIVFLSIVCVTGMIGNSFVIYIYKTRFKITTSRKWYILSLSFIDLFTCCIGIPLEISTMLKQYTFEHLWLCKTTRTVNTIGTNTSAFILLFIAFDRFRKICKPFGWQIQTSGAKLFSGLALFLGASVSLPAIFIYGKHTFDIPEYNMTGTECSTADEMTYTDYPFLYSILFGFLVAGGIILISIFYCLIGHKVWTHTRKMNTMFGKNMSIPKTPTITDVRDSKLVGEMKQVNIAENAFAQNKSKALLKKRSTKKDKHENNDSLTNMKGDALSLTSNQEKPEKEKNQTSMNKLVNVGNDFNNIKNGHNAVECKEKADTDRNEREEISNNENMRKNVQKSKLIFQEAEAIGIEMEAAQTSSEEILPNQNVVVRWISFISSPIFNVVMRIIFTPRARENPKMFKRAQFLNQTSARKTAFVMFLVTLGFVLSSLPHSLIMLIRQIKSSFVEELSDAENVIYKFILRSYFLNSAINPIIYSICDSQFKSALKDIFGRCFG